MQEVWDTVDTDDYERQQKKDMVTVEAFVQPTKISITRNNTPKQQQEPIKRFPFAPHYKTLYNQYINEAFEHYNQNQDQQQQEEEFSSLHTFSSEESGDEEATHSVDGVRKRRRATVQERSGDEGREKRKKFDISQQYACPLCGWGNAQHDSIEAPHFNKMIEIMTVNRGVHSDWDIAIQVSMYYMEDVYDPDIGMEPLTPEIVFTHITENHSLDAGSYITQRIKRRREYIFVMEQNLILEDGTMDMKMMEQINKTEKLTFEMYGKKPSTMLFGNGNNAEDMKRQANCVSLLPRFERVTTRKTKRRVIL